IAVNAWTYATVRLPMLLTASDTRLYGVVAILIAALALAGWVSRMRRPAVADLFLPLYIGLIVVWPVVWSGERFLLPALALILFYAADAFCRITARFAPRFSFAAGAAVAALLLIAAMPGLSGDARWAADCREQHRAGDAF